MTRNLTVLFVLATAGSAWAQESEIRFPEFQDPVILFTGAAPAPLAADEAKMELGPRLGYVKHGDADEGTFMIGVQLRVPLGNMFAIEASIDFHSSEFEDGDVEVIQWPVQVSALWFVLPNSKITPYVLGGLGWYYTTIDFSGSLSGVDSDTDSMFGAHLGIGGRLSIGKNMSLSADLRFIFIEPNSDELEDEDFDTTQFTVSLGFGI